MASPTIVAHRGLHDEHPENSLEAMRAAWSAGLVWCECDVRGSSEDEPVVFHDETLDRLTEARGPVDRLSLKDLQSLRLRLAGGALSPATIPTFEAIVNATPPAGRLLVEIKPEASPATVERAMRMLDPHRCVIQSFDRRILRRVHELDARFALEVLAEDAGRPIEDGPWRGINAQLSTLTPERVQAFRARGWRAGAWTVNTDEDIRRAIGLNLDTIITDRPLRVREML
jgi:glycerophosphoryl diester phosphodiesterase